MASDEERVEIWNTYLGLANFFANELTKTKNGNVENNGNNKFYSKIFKLDLKGGILPENEFLKLATILICNLAIEARINHMIEYEIKKDKTLNGLAKNLEWCNTKWKWFLLPFYTRNKKLDHGNPPHQAICDLYSLRNDLIHITYYKDLKSKLNDSNLSVNKVIGYYNNFIEAMFDLNKIMYRLSQNEFTEKYGDVITKLKI